MTAARQLDVIIVGAGIGGLGAAIAVSKAGHRVTVLEQAPDFVEVSWRRSTRTTTRGRDNWLTRGRSELAFKCPQMQGGNS